MSQEYFYSNDVQAGLQVPEKGILSQTLHNDENTKVILFVFAPGQELSAHTAPFPATLYFVKGEADLQLGADQHAAGPGAFAYMPPLLEHGIKAKTEVILLLTMVKAARVSAQ